MRRVTGQVLLAVGVVLFLGGVASFFLPNVELRYFGNVASTTEARVVWLGVTLTIAAAGLAMLSLRRVPDGSKERA